MIKSLLSAKDITELLSLFNYESVDIVEFLSYMASLKSFGYDIKQLKESWKIYKRFKYMLKYNILYQLHSS